MAVVCEGEVVDDNGSCSFCSSVCGRDVAGVIVSCCRCDRRTGRVYGSRRGRVVEESAVVCMKRVCAEERKRHDR